MSRIPIDPDAIRQLAAILVETGLSEIEIADKDNRIRVARMAAAPAAQAPATFRLPSAAVSIASVQASSRGTKRSASSPGCA